PYRGVRYHLDEWGAGRGAPQNFKELFNLRHAKARNVVERAFELLKIQWAILRSCSYFSIKTQNRIIMACCLLHNFIRTTMANDPMQDEVAEDHTEHNHLPDDGSYVDQVDTSMEWNQWRDEIAQSMFNEWRSNR
ncbi:hypothetical protein PHJA_001617000, partial [Phtheirospermum japonicum]